MAANPRRTTSTSASSSRKLQSKAEEVGGGREKTHWVAGKGRGRGAGKGGGGGALPGQLRDFVNISELLEALRPSVAAAREGGELILRKEKNYSVASYGKYTWDVIFNFISVFLFSPSPRWRERGNSHESS